MIKFLLRSNLHVERPLIIPISVLQQSYGDTRHSAWFFELILPPLDQLLRMLRHLRLLSHIPYGRS